MNNNRLLAVMLSFVLVAGMASPAFAQELAVTQSSTSEIFVPQHGNDDQGFTGPWNFVLPFGQSVPLKQSFTPTATNLVGVDIFICEHPQSLFTGVQTMTARVWDSDTPGVGNLLSTSTIDFDTTGIGCFINSMDVAHFDFPPTPLVPGDAYSFSIEPVNPFIGWLYSSLDPYPGGSGISTGIDMGFVTYFDDVVGGELLPIDSTALMIAGLQSSVIWMLPILAGAVGATALLVRKKF